jgi:hypothetical protein
LLCGQYAAAAGDAKRIHPAVSFTIFIGELL